MLKYKLTNKEINELDNYWKFIDIFSIIDKKLGSITYHNNVNNSKSKKAYHTYDYPEIYYNKRLYENTTEWIKEEFTNK